jgi:hypothetical protein
MPYITDQCTRTRGGRKLRGNGVLQERLEKEKPKLGVEADRDAISDRGLSLDAKLARTPSTSNYCSIAFT